MGFRILACLIFFCALVIIIDEIHSARRKNEEIIFELNRRITSMEESQKQSDYLAKDFMCVPISKGPFREVPSSLEEDLDRQDFRKGRPYK